MRLLLDNGLPRSTPAALAAIGLQAIHVGEIGMAASSDQAILARALAKREVIITLDADFHTLLALSGSNSPSVVRLRVEGLKAVPLAVLIAATFARFNAELQRGAVISVGNKTARCRLLPLR